jgi:hypothetical protein
MSRTTIGGRRQTLFGFVAVLGALLLIIGADSGRDVRAEGNKQETASLTVRAYEGVREPRLVMVTLLVNGKAIRSRQLDPGWFTQEKTEKAVTWENLPVGPYELQFQADGYEKSVYQIALSKEDKELKVGVPLMKKTGVENDPAFKHLTERISKLETDNAELRGTAARLQKEIDQLKKK